MTSHSTEKTRKSVDDAMDCDVLVIGSGAAGLTTAIVCGQLGLSVMVVEKADLFGGTTALSGGVVWIPGTDRVPGANDSPDNVRTYLRHELGNRYDEEAIEAFIANGPAMVDYLERETEVRFAPSAYPDYHPDAPGGAAVGRSLTAAAYDASRLGSNLKRLRPPLWTITFVGMMFNSSNSDLKHFFNATRSVKSALYVTKRLARHAVDLVRYGRGVQVTSGNALAARLAKSAFDLAIPILTSAPAVALSSAAGKITGAEVEVDGVRRHIAARRAVVLATGGFPHDKARTTAAYVHLRHGEEHWSPTPDDNTGDGIRIAEAAGGDFQLRYPSAAAWMPVSRVPSRDGKQGLFPHLVDRYKPGVIAVRKDGRRFVNESDSYHDVGVAMIEGARDGHGSAAWLICDKHTLAKYGLGFAKPWPMPTGGLIRSGYLVRGSTIVELAQRTGIDPSGLQATLEAYNAYASRGEDPMFGRGSTAFNRYLGDPAQTPNPNVAPIRSGPFYAVKIVMGDLGTFDGLRTSTFGEVLSRDGYGIEGLYAVGNDRASLMGGGYPGAGITLGPGMTFAYLAALQIAGRMDLVRGKAKGDRSFG
jgi:succinate dehydrogenase/fumarate reductase flavoprotein subunit